MREQTVAAIKQADLVVFLIDARAGVVAGDEIFAELVRSSGKPVILAANKVEDTRQRQACTRPSLSGSVSRCRSRPSMISASASSAILSSKPLAEMVARRSRRRLDEDAVHPLRIAVVGRPNVGKSTSSTPFSARSA